MAERLGLILPGAIKTLYATLLFLVFLGLSSAAQEQPSDISPPIRVVGPISQPAGFVNSYGEPTGFNVEVIRALGERIGRRVEVKLMANMRDALTAITSGKADVLYGAVPTAERREILGFSRPFSTTNVVLFALREREDEFENINYSKSRIGVRIGSLAESTVLKTLGVASVLYQTLEETMVALNTEEVDLVAAPQLQWDRSLRILNMEDKYVRVGKPLMEGDISLGVDLRQPELLKALDDALFDFMAEASFQLLTEKWYGTQDVWTVKKPSIEQILTSALAFALALMAVLVVRARMRDIKRRDDLQRDEMARSHARELQQKNEILKNNHDEMEKILFAVSHDLKSPIVTVRGFAGVLEEAAQESDLITVKSASKRILAGTERLGLLTDALLAFGSFGRSEISRTDIDLTNILENVKSMLNGELTEAGASLVVHKPLAPLYADESQILRLLLNLVGNALRYGCPRLGMTVEVSTEARNDGIVLNVRDHGPGVPESLRQQVFRLFHRYGPTNPNSTGLGLAIVQKIVEKHGASCGIEEGHGGGAVFRIFFPRKSITASL